MSTVRILIVDDHEAVRRGICSLLASRSEWTVCGEAADGMEAVEKTKSLRPDLVLMDVSLPRMDGVEAARIIRRERPETEIILVSQNDPRLLSRQSAEVGARGWISKTDLARNLLHTIGKVVDDQAPQGFEKRAKAARNGVKAVTIPADARPRRTAHGSRAGRSVAAELAAGPGERAINLLAAIVDSSDDAIISKNLDGAITSWNKSAERIFGYTAAEAIGQHITLIVPPERRTEEAEILERLRRGERVHHFQTVRICKDGTRVSVSLTISPVRDATGRVIGASKVARDVSERKLAEERERRIMAQSVAATAKFRAVFEQTSVFAGIMNNEGILLEANRLFLEGCGGYREDQVLGRPFWDTPWWREFKESRDKIRAATPLAVQGVPYRETLHYSWADGTQRLVEFALYPIRDDAGRVCFLHPTGVDITDLKNAEERYRSLSQTLDAEVQARTGELAERNAQVVRQEAQLRELSWRLLRTQDDERRHIARELHDSAGQTLAVLGMDLAQLVDKVGRVAPELVVDVEGIEGTLRQLQQEIRTTSYLLHPPLLDDVGLASALSWYVGGLAERTSLRVTLDIAEDIARLPREMELVVFRTVQECLTNIHRHSGSKTASIRIARQPDRITVVVKDSGCGISREKLTRLQSGGSGVGIAGMHERLRQFAGTLDISSDSSGTQILMTIPISRDSLSMDSAYPAQQSDLSPPKKATASKAAKGVGPGH